LSSKRSVNFYPSGPIIFFSVCRIFPLGRPESCSRRWHPSLNFFVMVRRILNFSIPIFSRLFLGLLQIETTIHRSSECIAYRTKNKFNQIFFTEAYANNHSVAISLTYCHISNVAQLAPPLPKPPFPFTATPYSSPLERI
jgi:hypothetical protein